MTKNNSKADASSKHSASRRVRHLHVLIVAACLLTAGAVTFMLPGQGSRAAAPRQASRTSPDGLWQDVAESSIPTQSPDRQTGPKRYRTLRVNMHTLRQQLVDAPLE